MSFVNCRAMTRPPIDFKAAKEAVGISDVLALVSFSPNYRRGDQLRGPCPVHDSQSPKSKIFSANVARNIYQCFSCGSQGDQLKLYAAVTGLPVYEATEQLCETLGIETPRKHRHRS